MKFSLWKVNSVTARVRGLKIECIIAICEYVDALCY